ncbi:MAG TPA: DUF885 domain-containing protein [Acidimicrobiales bacterium]|nr:DUF885 domain-containing protein [Acidimicrobiales bacterium]
MTAEGKLDAMTGRDATAEFRAAATATVDDLLRARPEWATTLGDHRFDRQLNDLSASGLSANANLLRRRREELSSFEPAPLDPEDGVDLAILKGELDRVVFETDALATFTWDPLEYNVGEALYPLLTRDVLPLPDRLRAIAARLDLIPERVALARRQLEAPPLVHVETALRQHPGTVAMVGEEVENLLAGEPGLRPVVEPAQARALAALDSYEGALHQLLEGPHRSARIGPDLFARRLALALHSRLSPSGLLEKAQRRVAELDQELAAVAEAYLAGCGDRPSADGEQQPRVGPAALGHETVRTALRRVAMEAPDDGTIVATAEAALVRCTEAVRDLGLVSVPEDPLRIEVMPVFRRGVAVAYCDQAGPLEEGGETSFAIAPTPEHWSAEQKASFYREYNHAMVVDLTVHEAMPGHMLQLAHARRFRGSTLVRTVLQSGSFIEGWGTHAERIMAEAGLGGPPVRLQQLKMQLRVAINAILDVSVHAGDLTEDQALELMTGRGYQEESEARAKWRRACLTSSQLSTYFVGYSELGEVLSSAGASPDDAGLDYDRVLAHGCPPPTLLAGLLRK